MLTLSQFQPLVEAARFDDYLKCGWFQQLMRLYPEKPFSSGEFLAIENIPAKDRVTLAFRLMPKEAVVAAAADIAESVLHIFEDKYPDDKRPREAIAATRRGGKNAAAYAAYAAAYAANAAANAYAAYAAAYAAYAAAYAAYAAAYAAYAAAYAANAANAYAANAAANAYANAAASAKKQWQLNLNIIKKHWRDA